MSAKIRLSLRCSKNNSKGGHIVCHSSSNLQRNLARTLSLFIIFSRHCRDDSVRSQLEGNRDRPSSFREREVRVNCADHRYCRRQYLACAWRSGNPDVSLTIWQPGLLNPPNSKKSKTRSKFTRQTPPSYSAATMFQTSTTPPKAVRAEIMPVSTSPQPV